MSKEVFIITYEAVADAFYTAQKHADKIDDFTKLCWQTVKDLGADGYRPCQHAGIRSILFNLPKAPSGWRKIGAEGNLIECVPNKRTKLGKEFKEKLSEHHHRPKADDLAREFGWSPNSYPVANGCIYFPTSMTVDYPKTRHFLRLPRQDGDNWTPPEGLEEIPESQFMAAIEAHNHEARLQNEALKA